MSNSKPGTIKILWIRSGIAFNRNQKEAVRSLGLRRLHQVVERPDTPGVRGLVAKVAHLVQIVGEDGRPGGPSVPEYQVTAAGAGNGGDEAVEAPSQEPETSSNNAG